MKLYINNKLIEEGSLEYLFSKRKQKIKELLEILEADGYCDKYAFEDYLFDIDKNKELNFYLDEGEGFEIEIRS